MKEIKPLVIVKFGLLLCTVYLIPSTGCQTATARLFDDLFHDYVTLVRPSRNASDVIHVSVQMTVMSLININEIEGSMDVLATIATEWHDISLTWDPTKYAGLADLVVPAEQVWLPDIVLSNSVSTFYDLTYKRDFHAKITHNGRVRWSFGGIFSTNCDIVLLKYPFDRQICSLDIESWMYKVDAVDMYFAEPLAIDLHRLQKNTLWELVGTGTESKLKYSKKFRSLLFTFMWKRKPMYYYVNVLGPCVVLMGLSLCVFWLPEESGEKISLAVIVVLALSFFQVVVMTNTPINSDVVPEISQIIVLILCLSTMALLTAMFVVYLSDRGTYSSKRAPLWLRKIFLLYLPKLYCMSEIIFHNSASDFVSEKNNQKRVIESNRNKIQPKSQFIHQSKAVVRENMGTRLYNQHDRSNRIFADAKYSQNASKMKPYTQKNHRNKETKMSISKTDPQLQTGDNDIKKIIGILDKAAMQRDKKSKSDHVKGEWKRIAKVVDRTLFWITLFLLIVFVIYIVFHITKT